MDAHEATEHNVDLWSQYFRQQWSGWLDPLGLNRERDDDSVGRNLADAAATGVANLITLWVAPPIDELFQVNAPAVSKALDDAAIAPESDAIPPEYLAYDPPPRRVREETASPGARLHDQAALLAF